MFLKKQWHRVVVEVKHENLVSHKLILGSTFRREEITMLTFPTSVSPSSERLWVVCVHIEGGEAVPLVEK